MQQRDALVDAQAEEAEEKAEEEQAEVLRMDEADVK